MGWSRLARWTALALVALSAAAQAADPGRWTQTGSSTMPLYYYQGVTSDPAGHFYFDGVDVGLYRTDSQLNEQARNDDVIPPAVTAAEGYNHVGDITWDGAEGGRILLPLECYYPPAGERGRFGDAFDQSYTPDGGGEGKASYDITGRVARTRASGSVRVNVTETDPAGAVTMACDSGTIPWEAVGG